MNKQCMLDLSCEKTLYFSDIFKKPFSSSYTRKELYSIESKNCNQLSTYTALKLCRATLHFASGVAYWRKRRRLHRRRYIGNGTNFVCYLYRHDKLKPFGFSIHNCIDGFLQYLIWREDASSN